MKLNLKIWRQNGPNAKGRMVNYQIDGVESDMSFLEMLDLLNENLIAKGEEPVAFDHDCREGICGMCSLYINGEAHGPDRLITTCQLHMRKFKDGETITIEPWRAKAFPVIKDSRWWIEAPWTESNKQVDIFPSIPRAEPWMPTTYQSQKKMQTPPLMQLLVSPVVPV